MRRLNVMVSCVVVGAMGMSVMAQEGQGQGQGRGRGNRPDQPAGERQPGDRRRGGGFGQPMDPAKAKAAWELEAKGVAKRLGLNDDQTKAVIKAYSEARESHTAAVEKAREAMRPGGGGGGDDAAGRMDPNEMRQKMEELNTKERDKLKKSLSAKLNGEQTDKAVAVLGTFNPQWDRMADALAGMNLDAAKQQEALNAVETFVVAQSKVRRGPDVDPQEMRDAMQTARENLQASLKKVLTEEQLEKFQASMGRGMRRGGGEGGGEGEPRRRDGGGGGGGGGGF